MEKKEASRGQGEPQLSPARILGDSVEHTCPSTLGGGGKAAEMRTHQLPICHCLKAASSNMNSSALLVSWCTGSRARKRKCSGRESAQAESGRNQQSSSLCCTQLVRGRGAGYRQRLDLHDGSPCLSPFKQLY